MTEEAPVTLNYVLIQLDGQVIERIGGGVQSSRQKQVLLGVVFAGSSGVRIWKVTQYLLCNRIDAIARNDVVREWRPVKDACAVVRSRGGIVDNVRTPGFVHQLLKIAIAHLAPEHPQHHLLPPILLLSPLVHHRKTSLSSARNP